ncbi:gp93 [Mycobacterium phage Omega]|uniref:Uncharacterized protein n=1 Tax=Mycobacterium phage Omega TaxID=2907835 RepID=Q854H3_BPMOM|nr:gp93 [Mycobacterium phage Omega]AAN12735.1 hypothetical protein PBI_OMEGA_93 [Mycobacterium phage Omega]
MLSRRSLMSWLNEPCPPPVNTIHNTVNRVELIDHRESSDNRGLVFSAWDAKSVLVSIQDDRTLKVFLS